MIYILRAIPNQRLFVISMILFAAGVTPIIIRIAQDEGVPSLVIVVLRLVLSSLILTPFVFNRYQVELRRLSRRDWALGIISGVWLALNLYMLFLALEYTTVLVTGVLRRTTPLWVILPEIFLLGAVFSRRVWVGLVFTIIGGVLIALGSTDTSIDLGSDPVLGAGIAAVGALCFGVYLLIGRDLRHKLPALAYSWLTFTTAAGVSILLVIVTRTAIIGYSPTAYIWIIVITILAQFVGHIFINIGLHHMTATGMGILLQVAVVLSALLAFLVFGEVPGVLQIIGSIVVMAGVLLASANQNQNS